MVGYPGQFDVFLAKLIAVLKGKPLVWDVFMSIYLIAKERGLNKDHRFVLSLVRWIEYIGLRLPDMLIQDTIDYVYWFENEYKIPPTRFRLVPTGADDRIFKPFNVALEKEGGKFLILYYGSFIPNHGVMKIAEAITQIKSRNDILFRFIGNGPEKKAFQSYINKHNIENVEILGWMSQENLIDQIAMADICLGVFGKTPQSLMTVQNKIYECLAMGKPIITGDSPAIRNALPPNTVFLCDRTKSDDISNAITALKNDLEKRRILSKNAITIFNKYFNVEKQGQRISNHLSELFPEP
jgi:glycosyltransferase involved in cell wall biosynthesis